MYRKFLPVELSKLAQSEKDGVDNITRFSGYLSTIGNVDSYGDIIHPGAFKKTLESRTWPVQMFYNHKLGAIGKYPRLFEDEYGLRFEDAELTPGHSVASDVAAGLRHQSIRGTSIGFMPAKWVSRDPEEDPIGWNGREYFEIDLFEGSVVDMPANVLAEIEEVRRLEPSELGIALEKVSTVRELEEVLRGSVGLSRRAVEMLTACQKRIFETPHTERVATLEKTLADERMERELLAVAERIKSIAK